MFCNRNCIITNTALSTFLFYHHFYIIIIMYYHHNCIITIIIISTPICHWRHYTRLDNHCIEGELVAAGTSETETQEWMRKIRSRWVLISDHISSYMMIYMIYDIYIYIIITYHTYLWHCRHCHHHNLYHHHQVMGVEPIAC